MSAATLVRRMHEHRLAHRAALLDLCGRLDDASLRREFPIGQGSLWATLAHLYAAERVWIDVIGGETAAPMPQPDDFADLPELLGAWERVDARWRSLLESVTDGTVSRTITRTNRQGRTYSLPLDDLLAHVAMHALYTTGQALAMLRQLGVEPRPTVDYVYWAAERGR